MPLQYGTRVRFTIGPLGLLRDPTHTRFEEATVQEGDEGTYIGPHPSIDGWSLVAVGDDLVCPCGPGQFEVVE